MTKYIQLLMKQREILKSRVRVANTMEKFIVSYRRKIKYQPKYPYQPAIGELRVIDKIIERESKNFGKLKFKVMGN